jgi:hypothetical protein
MQPRQEPGFPNEHTRGTGPCIGGILWIPYPLAEGNLRMGEEETMRRLRRILLFSLLFPIVFMTAGGCSTNRQSVRREKPVVSPQSEGWTFGFRAMEKELPPQELPFSVADEYRGRWLTLFETTASPVSAGNLTETKPKGD